MTNLNLEYVQVVHHWQGHKQGLVNTGVHGFVTGALPVDQEQW